MLRRARRGGFDAAAQTRRRTLPTPPTPTPSTPTSTQAPAPAPAAASIPRPSRRGMPTPTTRSRRSSCATGRRARPTSEPWRRRMARSPSIGPSRRRSMRCSTAWSAPRRRALHWLDRGRSTSHQERARLVARLLRRRELDDAGADPRVRPRAQTRKYLAQAKALYPGHRGRVGHDLRCGAHPGGIWWDRPHTQKATAGERRPAVITGARLAARTGDPTYLDIREAGVRGSGTRTWSIRPAATSRGPIYDILPTGQGRALPVHLQRGPT